MRRLNASNTCIVEYNIHFAERFNCLFKDICNFFFTCNICFYKKSFGIQRF